MRVYPHANFVDGAVRHPASVRDLEELLFAAQTPLSADTGELLRRYRDPSTVASLLNDLSCNEGALSAIAARSYHHAGGFEKLILAESSTGARVRLHVWPGRALAMALGGEGDIHDHFWAFASLVVVGRLWSCHYQTTQLPDAERHVRFRLKPGARGNCVLIPDGSERLGVVRMTSLGAGEVYSLSSSELHRAWATSHPTVTLVLQGPREEKANTVYRPCLHRPRRIWIRVRELKPARVQQLLRVVQISLASR